jgi:hypothetical protein
VTYTPPNGNTTSVNNIMSANPQRAAEQVLGQYPGSRVNSVQYYDLGGLSPNLLHNNRRDDDDIPELPGEFVDDPMANAQTYIIKYVDPDGAVSSAIVEDSDDEDRVVPSTPAPPKVVEPVVEKVVETVVAPTEEKKKRVITKKSTV